MEFNEAIRTFVRLLEATAERPFGLVSILAFCGSIVAYLLLRDVSPRLTGRLMWLVLASLAAVGLAVADTQQRSPALRYITIGRGAVPPSVTSPPSAGTQVPVGGGRTASSPTSTAGTSTAGSSSSATTTRTSSGGAAATMGDPGSPRGDAPAVAGTGASSGGSTASAGGGAVPGGGGVPSGAADRTGQAPGGGTFAFGTRDPGSPDDTPGGRSTWVIAGRISRELTTRDHRETARTTYGLRLEAGDAERLVRPELECLDGPCRNAIVQPPRIAADGRWVEAWFDVWDAPTRWRLTAVRERLER